MTRPVFSAEIDRFLKLEFYCFDGTWYLEKRFDWELPVVWNLCDLCNNAHPSNMLSLCDLIKAKKLLDSGFRTGIEGKE